MDDDEAVESADDPESASETGADDAPSADADPGPASVDDRDSPDAADRNPTDQPPSSSARSGDGSSQADLEDGSGPDIADSDSTDAKVNSDRDDVTSGGDAGDVTPADSGGPAETDVSPEPVDREHPNADVRARSDPDAAEDSADSPPTDAERTEPDADSAPDPDADAPKPGVPDPDRNVPEDVQKYARFKKMDGAQYDRVNEFLRDRTYVTAREWAIARLCADFRTETGVEMTKIGENLPELIPFMTDTYTPQAVNQARSSFDGKVRKAGATFLYGAMCDFYTAEELDDVMYEVTEVAKFLLEVEGVDLSVEEELEAEERISSVMREVREASKELRDREAE